MSNSTARTPSSHASTTLSDEPDGSRGARVDQGRRNVLHQPNISVDSGGQAFLEAPDAQALERKVAELSEQLARYQQEQSLLSGDEPFALGTGHVSGIVPPIAGASVRARSGSSSLPAHLISGDAWHILLGRFLKPNSQVLDIGCGSGMTARALTYNPNVKKYVGFDADRQSIEYCNQHLVPRMGERFEFHHVDVYSEWNNPQGALNPSELVFPTAGGSVDLAWSGSQFLHLLEADAKHFLREARRVLSPSGMLIVSILTNPEPGSGCSGDEGRFDFDVDYFNKLAAEVGLQVTVDLGEVCGQHALLFMIAPDSKAPKILNVDGAKTDEEVAEASKAKAGGVPIPANDGALTEEMIRLNALAAEKQDVTPDVHPDDFIFWFVASQLSLDGACNYYFEDGARSAERLDKELVALFGEEKQPIKLLEFASGYGCVARHLKKNPRLDLTSCDIHPAAINFLTNTIGVNALQSAHTPEQFAPPQKYDAIFALSFFSHMPKSTFGRWIKALYGALNAPGYLLFTTHGIKSLGGLQITAEDIGPDGFWFHAHSEQHDLDAEEYGVTLSLPEFVIPEVHRMVGAPIANYKQAAWWNHQDLWIVKRER